MEDSQPSLAGCGVTGVRKEVTGATLAEKPVGVSRTTCDALRRGRVGEFLTGFQGPPDRHADLRAVKSSRESAYPLVRA
jgi:hypothetical protein